MVTRIKNFISRPTSRHVIINTVGNYLNVFFTAFFAFLLVRILSPSQYGVFSVLFSISIVLANIMDFGTSATIYSYLPPLIGDNRQNLYRFVKSIFFYQTIFSMVAITILIIAFPYLDRIFFKTQAPNLVLYLTLLSVLFFIWQNFVMNCLFAAKRFLQGNLYLNLANVIKTVIIFILALTGTVSVGSIIFVFGILGPMIFFLLLFIQKKDLVFILLKTDARRKDFRMNYTLTYFISSQFFNLGMRMDLFLLSYFLVKEQVGYYGLAQKIILSIMSTVISITQVLSPGFSRTKTKKEIVNQFKHGFLYMMIPSAVFLLLFLTPNWIFDIFFTKKFSQTAAISRSLALPYILYGLSNVPALFLLYTVRKPKYSLIASIFFFAILTGGCYILIPKMGVFGPPYAITAAFLVSFAITVAAAFREYKMADENSFNLAPTTA